MTTRRATHAGSWYTSNGKSLSKELDGWLQAASAKVSLDCLVVIWSIVGPYLLQIVESFIEYMF